MNLSPAKLSFESVISTIQEQRAFTRLALVEEMRCLDEGELDEARQWARAAFRSGGHSTYRGCMIQAFVGSAIHSMSTSGLAKWAERPEVTAEQLQSALAQARSDYTLYESRSAILKAEYLGARNTLATPHWLQIIGPANSNSPPDSPIVAKISKMAMWVVGEPELTARAFRQILANQIREIDKPVSRRPQIVGSGAAMLFDDANMTRLPGQLDADGIDRIFNRSFLLRIMAPAARQADTALLRQEGRQAAFEVLLAAQAYRRDHGEFPETLSQLIPKYIDAIPSDPCDPNGGPILYRRDEATKAVVWSVGDDGADGGGDVDSAANSRPGDVGFQLK